MDILERPELAVERAIVLDLIDYEGASVVVIDERAAVLRTKNWFKCVFIDVEDIPEYAERYDIAGNITYMNLALGDADAIGLAAAPCKSYAYLRPMPPALAGVEIRRLAPSLAAEVLSRYHNPGGAYTLERMEELMRQRGVFGAIANGKLAGFIGMHDDGCMGMLEVEEKFRRRGFGEELEKFMINYIMTFSRVPYCDVYLDNAPSQKLQDKLGLTPAGKYTFWEAKR